MPSSLNLGMLMHALRIGNDGRSTTQLGALTITAKGKLSLTPKGNPATCVKGDLNVATDGKLYVCSSTNTWTAQT